MLLIGWDWVPLDMLGWKGHTKNVSYVGLVVGNSDVFAVFFSFLLSKLVSEHARRSVTNLESRLKTLQKIYI